MEINPCSNMKPQQLTPTAMRKMLCYDDDYMFLYMECKKGTSQPPHNHEHIQIDYIIEGEIEFQCADEIATLKAGDVVKVPSNVPHCFKNTIEDAKWIEFFTPIRKDILESNL